MQRILIACDKFKGSLDALAVCEAIKSGIKSRKPALHISMLPLADGGDGTLEVLSQVQQYYKVFKHVVDPLGRPIEAYYLSDGTTAIVELAVASGIARLQQNELDVLNTTTLGTGMLVQDAIDTYHNQIILSVGGSCTHDLGLGLLYALGAHFVDDQGGKLIPQGGNLTHISRIILPKLNSDIRFKVLVDVDNPLYGDRGAAQVYGPQKGATEEDIKLLDKGARHISSLIRATTGVSVDVLPGGGAAGGIAAGCAGLLNADITSGFDFISEVIGLDEKLQECDVVITGEGRLDSQSFNGKVVGRLARSARQLGKTVIVISGSSDVDEHILQDYAVSQSHTILDIEQNIEKAILDAPKYLRQLGANVASNL